MSGMLAFELGTRQFEADAKVLEDVFVPNFMQNGKPSEGGFVVFVTADGTLSAPKPALRSKYPDLPLARAVSTQPV